MVGTSNLDSIAMFRSETVESFCASTGGASPGKAERRGTSIGGIPYKGWGKSWGYGGKELLPSGELTEQWKITIFHGKIHYFYGHVQLLC